MGAGERGEHVEAAREMPLPLDGPSLAAEVARTGELLRIDEPYEDPRFDPSVDARTGYRTRSILVVPIDSRDRIRLGVLQAVNHKGGPFHAEEERYAVALAGSAGIAPEYVPPSTRPAAARPRGGKGAGEGRPPPPRAPPYRGGPTRPQAPPGHLRAQP